jgi:FkbM family methyltransferase
MNKFKSLLLVLGMLISMIIVSGSVFAQKGGPAPQLSCGGGYFTDVPPGSTFADAVDFVICNGFMDAPWTDSTFHPNTFKLLEINVVLNDVKNATLHNIAAWDSDTQLEFLASKDNTGGSKVQPKSKDRFEFTYDTPTVISVPAKKLDEVLEGQTFGLVVMDIEGSEWRALKGMPTLMKNVSKLVLEILPNHLENVAGVSPADFFSALPAHFTSARPINVPEMKEHYSKNDFLAMYAAVVKHHFMDGIDVIFSA